ncbi:MAG TPA: hypothetical protein VNH46_09070 [Gemmatimonadales bacterium]|nr:hypothetical protein [Gemmatimonadales bacterium]
MPRGQIPHAVLMSGATASPVARNEARMDGVMLLVVVVLALLSWGLVRLCERV